MKKQNIKNKKAPKQQQATPKKVDLFLNSKLGSDLNIEMAAFYELTVGELAKMTIFISELYDKKVLMKDFEKKFKELFPAVKMDKMMMGDVLGKKLLIYDREHFGGEVSKKMTELGLDSASYTEVINSYKEAVKEELEIKKKAERKEKLKSEMKKEDDFTPAFLKDPEGEKKSIEEAFQTMIGDALRLQSYAAKKELNARIITLCLMEGGDQFHAALLKELYNNKEKLTKIKIQLKKDKVDGTVGNWLKDYIHFVGIDEVVNTIQKTKYYVDSPNVRSLKDDQKKLLDNLLDLYINLKNFFEIAQKTELSDIEIFSISEEEIETYVKQVEQAAKNNKTKANEENQEPQLKEVDIEKLYIGDPEERNSIDLTKSKLSDQTRNELSKLADYLEEQLLRRRKVEIVSGLELVAEIGALDNLLAKDRRYTEYLIEYFKRNNLQDEIDNYKKDPYQAKYIEHFLKFVFLERLGMKESQGARYAANISRTLLENGSPQYGQLAYLDLSTSEFKWS